MNQSHEPPRPKSFTHTILLGVGGLFASFILYAGVDYVIDFLANPWAYGMFGRATPQGEWIGNATLNDGKKYHLKLALEHVVSDNDNILIHPDLTGEAQACTGGLARSTSSVSGEVGWTGRSVSLDTAFARGLGKPVTTCRFGEDTLTCTLFYDNKVPIAAREAMKRLRGERVPRTVQVTFTRLRQGASPADLCAP